MDSVSPSKNGFLPFSGFTLGLGYGSFQTKWLTPVRNSEPFERYFEFLDKKFKGITLDISLVRQLDWAQRRNGASFHLLLSHHRESHTSTITSALPFSIWRKFLNFWSYRELILQIMLLLLCEIIFIKIPDLSTVFWKDSASALNIHGYKQLQIVLSVSWFQANVAFAFLMLFFALYTLNI